MSERSENVRVHIWVKGHVQAVGFRAFVQHTAIQVGVTGWVRNVGYDKVEVVAEGEKDTIVRFTQMIIRGPVGSRVDDWQEEWEPVIEKFARFEVRRSM